MSEALCLALLEGAQRLAASLRSARVPPQQDEDPLVCSTPRGVTEVGTQVVPGGFLAELIVLNASRRH